MRKRNEKRFFKHGRDKFEELHLLTEHKKLSLLLPWHIVQSLIAISLFHTWSFLRQSKIYHVSHFTRLPEFF